MAAPCVKKIERKIVGAGCNRTHFAVDWGSNNIIASGTCNTVLIQKSKDCGDHVTSSVVTSLTGHTNRINCVRWVSETGDGEPSTLLSGSVDTTVRVWSQVSHEPLEFNCTHVLTGHSGAVTSVNGIKVNGVTKYVVSASADCTVCLWILLDTGHNKLQTISYGNGFALNVAATTLPHGVVLVACAVTDHKIHLYALTDSQLQPVMELTGHKDWVRSVSFTNPNSSEETLMASCSQDHTIRIWRIKSPGDTQSTDKKSESKSDIKVKENCFSVTHAGVCSRYSVALESVLSGHEGWVQSVRWQWDLPHLINQEDLNDLVRDLSLSKEKAEVLASRLNQWNLLVKGEATPCLLSASMDKTIIVWKQDEESGVWIDQVRVGEVGGNTLGFYGAVFSPKGNMILAHGYQGAFHQWKLSPDLSSCKPSVTVKGHFNAVMDIAWDPNGQYLLSCSIDQTTRLFAPWIKNNEFLGWYEIARPQIHGYDMQCLAVISPFCFASGADEKVIRVFQAPANFISNFRYLTEQKGSVLPPMIQSQPEGASVPALGLSNKAIFTGKTVDMSGDLNKIQLSSDQKQTELFFTSVQLTEPPTEEHLLQNTLWPEVQKLYAHSYEIFSLAASPDGTLLASTSKATKPEYARIILWSTSTWQPITMLDGPSLTVTQLQFSHNGHYLLAVSRDRTWHLYSISHSEEEYVSVAKIEKKTSIHARIIWACCWSHDDVYFATASRDKKVVVWRTSDQSSNSTKPYGPALATDASVTAVDMAPVKIKNRYLMAVGLETGVISLYSWEDEPPIWHLLHTLDNRQSHTLTVKRLCFRPLVGRASEHSSKDRNNDNDIILQLASCSEDFTVNLYDLTFDNSG